MSAAAASASTLLRIVACVRNRGQATTSRWRRWRRQHARCAKPGKMGATSPQAFQDGMPDGSEHARPAHRRYALEHAGGNVHREVLEQPNQYRRNPAVPSSPLLTVEQSWACYRDLGEELVSFHCNLVKWALRLKFLLLLTF